MTDVRDKVVVLTGAGAGIGRALAVELARAGADLALSDVDEVGLQATAALAAAHGTRVHTSQLDVSNAAAVQAYADEVVTHFGAVHVLVSNAGIAFIGDFEDVSLEQMHHVMDVDFWGMVHGTKAFLPHLIASGGGHVVNVASVAAIMAAPTQSAYTAAKFAVRGLSEALRIELMINRHPVKVTCVMPGGVRTDINRNAQAVRRDAGEVGDIFDRLVARTSPEAAARQILRGISRNRPQVLVGPDAKAVNVLIRLIGPRYQRLLSLGAARMMPPKVDA